MTMRSGRRWAVATIVAVCGVIALSLFFAVTRSDKAVNEQSDKAMVNTWLRQNLPDGKWEEIRWQAVELSAIRTREIQFCDDAMRMQRDKTIDAYSLWRAVEKLRDYNALDDKTVIKPIAYFEQRRAEAEASPLHRLCGIRLRTKNKAGANEVMNFAFETTSGVLRYLPNNSDYFGLYCWQYLADPNFDPSAFPSLDAAMNEVRAEAAEKADRERRQKADAKANAEALAARPRDPLADSPFNINRGADMRARAPNPAAPPSRGFESIAVEPLRPVPPIAVEPLRPVAAKAPDILLNPNIPANYMAYFVNEEKAKAENIRKRKEAAESHEFTLRTQNPKGPQRIALTAEITKANNAVELAKKQPGAVPLNWNAPEIGQIGILNRVMVLAVIDDKTVLTELVELNGVINKMKPMVITKVKSTKSISVNNGDVMTPDQIWIITSEGSAADNLDSLPDEWKSVLAKSSKRQNPKFYVLDIINKGDFKQYQKIFEEDRKAATNGLDKGKK